MTIYAEIMTFNRQDGVTQRQTPPSQGTKAEGDVTAKMRNCCLCVYIVHEKGDS